MTTREAEYRQALNKQNAAQAKVNNLRSKLDPLFKASQPYHKAALEVEASLKHSQAVHREEVEKVRQSEPYEKQKAEHAAADVTIRRLTDKVEFQDPVLQAALKAKGKAASAMANMEAQVVLSNPRYLEATARSKAAEKQREDARKAFDAEQEKKPELAAALKALAHAQREAKEAEKAAEAAKDRFDKMLRLRADFNKANLYRPAIVSKELREGSHCLILSLLDECGVGCPHYESLFALALKPVLFHQFDSPASPIIMIQSPCLLL